MTDKEVIKTFKKHFIWVSIISILVIVVMGLIINSQSKQLAYVYENYDYSCSEGTRQVCISENKNYIEYPEGEYAITIKDDETYTICDTDRRERAVCIDEDKSWIQCGTGEWATCVGENERVMNCEADEDARCIKEDMSGYITSSGYINYCSSGEFGTCIS